MPLSVWIQPRDSQLVQLGTQHDGGRGVIAESLDYSAALAEYGCDSATFRLRQSPRWIRTYLEAFTPVIIRDGARDVWSGRIIAQPTVFGEDDQSVTVECQGWGQHLKDATTPHEWVINDLSRFRPITDSPGILISPSSNWHTSTSSPVLANGDGGALSITWPKGIAISQYAGNGYVLDLGPDVRAKRVRVQVRKLNFTAAQLEFYVRGTSAPDFHSLGGEDASVHSMGALSASNQWVGGTFAVARRYVHLYCLAQSGFAAQPDDGGVIIENILVVTDTADESSNASALTASKAVGDTIDRVAPLLSMDRSLIQSTSLPLPSFPGDPGERYGNELLDRANAMHGWIIRLTPSFPAVPEFFPPPSDYTFVVGRGEYKIEEPAAQDGRAVYSRVVSEFEDARGMRDRAIADATDLANDFLVWNDTGAAAAGEVVYVRAIVTETGGGVSVNQLSFPSSTTPDKTDTWTLQAGEWETRWYAFTQRVAGTVLYGHSATGSFSASFRTYRAAPNAPLPVKRGFVRTSLRPMSGRSTTQIAQARANLELEASRVPTFKGTITKQGRIRLKNGDTMRVSAVPSMVGAAVLLEDMFDHGTQSLGRQGVIHAAAYNEETDTVRITIDSQRTFVDALLARLDAYSRR